MTLLGVALRWAHLSAALLLVGTAAFLILAGRPDKPTARRWAEASVRHIRWLVLAALVSGIGVLSWQAGHMAGRPSAALEPASLRTVLLETRFGTVWLVRHALLFLLAAVVFFREREDSTVDWATFRAEACTLASGVAAAMAWAGHAGASESASVGPVLADAAHVVAGGLWLGALLPLAALLRAASTEAGADTRPYAVLAVRGFSRTAVGVMTLVVATGLVQTWTQVGDVPGLVGTRYGWVLALKVLLLIGVVAIAARSRRIWVPALSGPGAAVGRPAMTRLGRLVIIELALGLGILLAVAVLAATPPARHEVPWWPLSWRLDWSGMIAEPGVKPRLLVGGQLAILGALVALVGLVAGRRRLPLLGGGVAALATGLAVALPPLSVDAYPTTYRRPAVAYTAASIASGQQLYETHCVSCHGHRGKGDGPEAARLARPPADLTAAHTSQHTAGDLYWWLGAGIPRAGMPGFGDRLSQEERWDLVNLVRALSSGEAASRLGPRIEPGRPRLVAPDFTYRVGPGPARTLRDFRGQRAVLLVLFSLPASHPRLSVLANAYDTLRGLGAEILAVPADGEGRVIARLGGEPPMLFPVATDDASDIVKAWMLLAGAAPGPGASSPPHVEFLVDRQGYVRARWAPGMPGAGWTDPSALSAELQALAREAPAPPADEHVH